ncbi:hypothetical protein ACIPZ8_14925 [Pseudomonas sp. NPDC089422]|uniref:hypothetical protein n=1 Tax=Pseudomonas sp. NPDC089422 TaxID=3364466 RepID=UPI003809E021
MRVAELLGQALHAANGVYVQLQVQLTTIKPGPLLKIRMQTNAELAQTCGFQVEDDILIDSACATCAPQIFPAGEVPP